jgi:hypothetical protein
LGNRHGVFNFNEDSAASSSDGEWKEDNRSRNGTLILKSGNKYFREFKDDLQDGEGVLFSTTNEIIEQGHLLYKNTRSREQALPQSRIFWNFCVQITKKLEKKSFFPFFSSFVVIFR